MGTGARKRIKDNTVCIVVRGRTVHREGFRWGRLAALIWGMGACLALCAGPARAAPPDSPGPTLAQGRALALKNQCLACHQIDSRRVGPPFRAVARRFQGQPDAARYLAQVMRQGSSGQWGAIPMPAQTRLSAPDALRLAQWILSLNP
jgi:cytochrome c